MEQDKVAGINQFHTPTSKKQLQSFLGACNYYRRFVKNYSHTAAPLNELLADHVRFVWGERQERAFAQLKHELCNTPVLAFPQPDGVFVLDTDASEFGIGSVLSQVVEEDNTIMERPIAYYAKTLAKAAKNYCVTRKELLAVVKSVEHFRPYLLGEKFLLRTDHGALEYMVSKTSQVTDPVVIRMLEVLSQFNYTLVYRKGANHTNADACSRALFCEEGCKFCRKHRVCCATCDAVDSEIEEDLCNPAVKSEAELKELTWDDICRPRKEKLLKELETNEELRDKVSKGSLPRWQTQTATLLMAALELSKEDGFARDEFNRAQEEDEDIGPLMADLRGATSGESAVRWRRATTGKLQRLEQVIETNVHPPAGSPAYMFYKSRERSMFMKDGTVFYRHYVRQHCSAGEARFIPQRVVPKALKNRVLRLYHEGPGATHPRVAKMKFLIAQQFMWYRSGDDVEQYVRRCNNCAKRMTRGELQKRKRKLKHQQMGPVMHQIQMDLVGPLKPVPHDGKKCAISS